MLPRHDFIRSIKKIPITRGGLCAEVLAAIREHPRCHGVKEIAITLETILDVGTTWHVTIIDGGDTGIELAYAVARKVQEQLSPVRSDRLAVRTKPDMFFFTPGMSGRAFSRGCHHRLQGCE